MTITNITLGQLLSSEDITIKRNAMSILKVIQKCDHSFEEGSCIYCFSKEQLPIVKNGRLMCFWCKTRPATIKDYREIDGTTGSYPSCSRCVNKATEDVI